MACGVPLQAFPAAVPVSVQVRGILSIPAAQLDRGGDLLQPLVDCGIRLAHTAWPQTLDQDTHPVRGIYTVKDTLAADLTRHR